MAENPDDIPNIDDPPGPSADAAESAPSAAATPPPKPESPGFLARLRARRAQRATESKPSHCVVIGPIASGKTLMLVSLEPSADHEVHSYADRFKVTVHGGDSEDYLALRGRQATSFEDGLKLSGSRACFTPEFTLVITDKKTKKQSDERFRTFDGPGGLIIAEDFQGPNVASEDRACRAKLLAALQECETVMLCLPIVKEVTLREKQALKDLIDKLRKNRGIRRLVVCLTMYEKLGIDLKLGRHAFRVLANRTEAKRQMRNALEGDLSAVNNVLEQFFNSDPKREAWCVPVSTYGFVPFNGGPNVELVINRLEGGKEEQVERLRVWPTQSERPHPSSESAPPYDMAHAQSHLWRPFLTLDPFIFIATGKTKGTLIHSYDEILS